MLWSGFDQDVFNSAVLPALDDLRLHLCHEKGQAMSLLFSFLLKWGIQNMLGIHHFVHSFSQKHFILWRVTSGFQDIPAGRVSQKTTTLNSLSGFKKKWTHPGCVVLDRQSWTWLNCPASSELSTGHLVWSIRYFTQKVKGFLTWSWTYPSFDLFLNLDTGADYSG